MKLINYIWKGFYYCIVNPILMLCRLVYLIVKYFFIGLFSPVILLSDRKVKVVVSEGSSIEDNNISKNSKKQIKFLKFNHNKMSAAERKEKRRLAKIQKQEQNKIKVAERKKEQERRKEERRLAKIQKQENKNKILSKKKEQKQFPEKQNLDKTTKKEELKLKRAEKKKLRKERFEQARKKKQEEKARLREIRKTETIEERKIRKEQERKAKAEKRKLDRQKKIEAIHEKQAKKEQELYELEKAKQQAKIVKDEAKRKKKEQQEELKQLKKKKEQEAYINENVTIEKKGLAGQIQKIIRKLKSSPIEFKRKLNNNAFAKSARNRRDMNRQALLIDFESEDAKRSDIKLIYEYEAKSPEGKMVKGHFEAFSKVEVHSFLLSEGYEVYKIQTNKWISLKYASTASNRKKFKNKDLIFFLTQLSTYLKAGITLSEALKILGRQFSSKKAYENIFKSINYELSIGESFSDTLSKQGSAFPKLLINMLKTAEMTGSLPEVLDDMAVYYSEMEETRRQMVTAMMYPSIVGVFATGVITFILIYVVPQFNDIYESMDGVEVPTFTKVILGISDFLKAYIFMILIVIVIIVLIIYYLYRNNKLFRTVLQWGMMHTPIFKNVIIYNEVTTFTKTFGSLLSHNVPIIDCMDILNKITNNEIYKMLILDVITNLARGGKISESFEGQWSFPVPAYEMIVTGEKTGELAEMMNKVSLYYQDLHKNSVTRIKTFIEPALTVFLAGATGIIVLAIVIPMFNMYSSVSEM